MIQPLTQEHLRELISYDAETGHFHWKTLCSGRSTHGGKPLGSQSHGYLRIRVENRLYYAHRLAWFYAHGEWPKVIDHINGIRSDNRLSNLRNVTQAVNCQNHVRPMSTNTTGYLGVTRTKQGRFLASLSVNRRTHYFGSFATAEEASEAYLQAKRQLHAGCSI